MPITLTVCDGERGNLLVSSGVVTDQELIDSIGRLFSRAEQINRYRYIIFDYSAVTKMTVMDETIETVGGLYAAASRSNPDICVAVVTYFSMVVSIEMMNKITRIYEPLLHRTNWESLLFRTRMEAVRWVRNRARDKFGIEDLTFD